MIQVDHAAVLREGVGDRGPVVLVLRDALGRDLRRRRGGQGRAQTQRIEARREDGSRRQCTEQAATRQRRVRLRGAGVGGIGGA